MKEARRNRTLSPTAMTYFRDVWDRRMKALRRYVAIVWKHRATLEELHRQELPGCPWDGEQLVFPPAPPSVPTKIVKLYRHEKRK